MVQKMSMKCVQMGLVWHVWHGGCMTSVGLGMSGPVIRVTCTSWDTAQFTFGDISISYFPWVRRKTWDMSREWWKWADAPNNLWIKAGISFWYDTRCLLTCTKSCLKDLNVFVKSQRFHSWMETHWFCDSLFLGNILPSFVPFAWSLSTFNFRNISKDDKLQNFFENRQNW